MGVQQPRNFTQQERDLARQQDANIHVLVRQLTPPEIIDLQRQAHQQMTNARADIADEHFRAGNPKYRLACTQSLADFNTILAN